MRCIGGFPSGLESGELRNAAVGDSLPPTGRQASALCGHALCGHLTAKRLAFRQLGVDPLGSGGAHP